MITSCRGKILHIFPPTISKLGSANYAKWLVPIGIPSFILSIFGLTIDPSATFYLLPTRAWELFIGSVLAMDLLPNIKSKASREILAATGLLLVTYSAFFYNSNTPFPGLAAVFPTVGAALIIFSGTGGISWTGRLLSLKPMVFIGLISYSLYLWHWPIIVFTKYFFITALAPYQIAIMMCAIWGCAVLSWYFVEKPFSGKGLVKTKTSVFYISLAASATIITFSVLLLSANGLPHRHGHDWAQLAPTKGPEWSRWNNCEIKARQGEYCTVGTTGTIPKHFFVGRLPRKSNCFICTSSGKIKQYICEDCHYECMPAAARYRTP